jgi:predicted transcriptional regulator
LEAEEEAADLLSELGSEDRLKILEEIHKEPLKTSQIALKLSSSIQEASRQCGRLEDVGLIERHADGKFVLTSLGKITISLAPAFALLGEEREYFNSHDPTYLPSSFLQRISELSSHSRINHIDDALKFQQRVVKESEKFVWFMSDQPVGHSFRESHSHFPPGVSLRLILPKGADTDVFRDAKNFMGERFEIGLVEDMRLVLAMNEKMAAFGLPTLDGRPDYSRGLVGDSAPFHGWCCDLFSHYWEASIKKYPRE